MSASNAEGDDEVPQERGFCTKRKRRKYWKRSLIAAEDCGKPYVTTSILTLVDGL